MTGAVRPEKAEAATTGMNGGEESDRVVVPMNAAEQSAGAKPARRRWGREGREPRRTPVRSRTPPTQDGRGVSQGLAGVRKAARERKQERFTALLHHLTVDLLRESFLRFEARARRREWTG